MSTLWTPDPALADFRDFLGLVWQTLGLPKPTAIQYDIAHFMQHGPKRQVIQAQRGEGKTYIGCAYCAWSIYQDPDTDILSISASLPFATQSSTFVRQLFKEMEVLHPLCPTAEGRNSTLAWDCALATPKHSPTFKSVGITGQLAGSRARTILMDDVEQINNADTQLKRDKLSERIKEIDAILKPDTATHSSRVLVLGTPQTEDTIYRLLEKRGYSTRIWPARLPNQKQRSGYGDKLAPIIERALEKHPTAVGKPTDPQRFSEADLAEREASFGRSGFALQFMLDTTLSDAERYPLKHADLVVMDLDTAMGPEWVTWASGPDQEWKDLPLVGLAGDRYYRPFRVSEKLIPYKGSCLAIDPGGFGRDETGWVVIKNINAQLFLLDCGGLFGGHTEKNLQYLANKAKEHAVNYTLLEANFGDGMYTSLLKPYLAKTWPCGIEEVTVTKQKELRIIETLEPVMNQHKLIVNRKLIELDYTTRKDQPAEQAIRYQLFYQLSRITKDRGALAHEDRLDALSLGVGHWVSAMAVDTERAAALHDKRIREMEIKSYLKGSKGVLVGSGMPRPPHQRDAGNAVYRYTRSDRIRR